jgi:hypothetical protein
MLEPIYNYLKEIFEKRRDAMTADGFMPRYDAPDELLEENVQDIIDETNNMVSNATANLVNNPDELIAASKKSNLILSMARDNHSAQMSRLDQVANYLNYTDKALYESPDLEDFEDTDGLLAANIRRVEQ